MTVQWDDSELLKLSADLEKAGDRIGKEVAAALRKAQKDLQAKAQALSPVRTGELQAGWQPHGGGDGRSGSMSAGIRNTTRQGFFQEYGTSKHPPQPSGGPALEAITPAFIADMEKAAGEVLD